VLTTEGFGLFRDEAKRSLLRRLAKERGLVILTDSDGGGRVIRSYLHTVTGGEGVTDLYVPPVKGKERRKKTAGKAGILGVEGTENGVILSLFARAGLLEDGLPPAPRYTKADLYRMGYSGREGSEQKRRAVLEKNGLPADLSGNSFLEMINGLEIELDE